MIAVGCLNGPRLFAPSEQTGLLGDPAAGQLDGGL